MSLIEEALRQVQDTAPSPSTSIRPARTSTPQPVPSPARPVHHEPAPAASSRADSAMPVAAMASLAVAGLLSLAWQTGGWWRAQVSRTEPTTRAVSRGGPSASLSSPVPTPAESSQPAFSLSGIVEQGGAKMAVVNNTIVQAGDLVDGARVLEVRRDSVWLRTKNQDVILKTNR